MLDLLYGQVMRVRRRRAERHAEHRRRLSRPVISVGNLSMGGTGKSPVVSALAQWLVARGERPSILSRGYARADAADGVVVASDGTGVRATVDRAGDEPLMLARQTPGAVVCVSPDRYLAGVLAERVLGCTVHVLDDGFQHVELMRDVDVLVTTVGEIPEGRVIPRGRLREPIDAASRAHVLVVSGATAGAASAEAWALGISQSCGAERILREPILVGRGETGREKTLVGSQDAGREEVPGGRNETGWEETRVGNRDTTVIVVAGIAHPERFAESLQDAGWRVGDTMAFPDHHRYTRADVERIADAMRRAGAGAVFTTDKDAVRFEVLGALPFPLYRVPLALRFDPADALFASVEAAVGRREQAAVGVQTAGAEA